RYDMDEDEALHHLPVVRGRTVGAVDRSADNSSPPPLRGRAREGGNFGGAPRRVPLTIEGELVAKSTGTVSRFALGDRVFHQKFGNGNITAIDGNKLTIQFDRAGEKRVVDSFVERV
ncbi:MAG: hypothetical protein ACM3PO_02680, partial [Betaproteobacteria bacterium]